MKGASVFYSLMRSSIEKSYAVMKSEKNRIFDRGNSCENQCQIDSLVFERALLVLYYKKNDYGDFVYLGFCYWLPSLDHKK
jgi:hypothetical protein